MIRGTEGYDLQGKRRSGRCFSSEEIREGKGVPDAKECCRR